MLNLSVVMWRGPQRSVGSARWRSLTPFDMSTNYSSEGHPGINAAQEHRMLRVLVSIFWKISLCHSVSCSFLHGPCASNVLNKRLRKFDRSWKERRTVAHHLQAAFWCHFLGEVMPVRRAREALLKAFTLQPNHVISESHRNQSGSWVNNSFTDITSSRFWVLGGLALAQKGKDIPTWQNN